MDISILYIDDDLDLSSLVEEYLEGQGMAVKLLHNPNEVIGQLKSNEYDLCLMDVKMPEKDGFTLAQEIKDAGIKVPFLFLTGQTRKEDRIKGLKLGAEDFISKPFSLEELFLRITNINKRVQSGDQRNDSIYALGQYQFHADFGELKKDSDTLNLSGTEAKLLHLFCQKPNQLLQRSEILTAVWGDDDYYKGLSLNVYITRLRKRFKDEKGITIINEHGQGYKFMIR